MMKFTIAVVTFLICTTLLSTAEARADGSMRPRLRCQCVRTYSGQPINPKIIQKFQIIPPGAQCKYVEIIATLRTGKTCLNPKDDWVKRLWKNTFPSVFT